MVDIASERMNGAWYPIRDKSQPPISEKQRMNGAVSVLARARYVGLLPSGEN